LGRFVRPMRSLTRCYFASDAHTCLFCLIALATRDHHHSSGFSSRISETNATRFCSQKIKNVGFPRVQLRSSLDHCSAWDNAIAHRCFLSASHLSRTSAWKRIYSVCLSPSSDYQCNINNRDRDGEHNSDFHLSDRNQLHHSHGDGSCNIDHDAAYNNDFIHYNVSDYDLQYNLHIFFIIC
jgi:hypothetical protein